MHIRFYIDPETGLPHIYDHGVSEVEVEEVLRRPGDVFRGTRESRIVLGQTQSGRHLKVVYVSDPRPESVFVITAYEMTDKLRSAFRRRRRRK